MPGRFALTAPIGEVAKWMASDGAAVEREGQRWNIAPSQEVVVAMPGRRLERLRWGMEPPGRPGQKKLAPVINARSETVAEKPMFREAARMRRCLVPATAWYEWTPDRDGKRAWRVQSVQGLMAFAGIYENGFFVTLTCEPNELMRKYHHRMPVIISPEKFGLWLGEEGKGAARLMVPAPEDLLVVGPVSDRINSARFEGPLE